MIAVDRLCDQNLLLSRSNSPLMTRGSSPNSLSYSELSTVIEEDDAHPFDDSHPIAAAERFFPRPPATHNSAREFQHSLDNVMNLLNDPLVQKEVALNPNFYYEDYKALTLYLEYYFCDKNENLASGDGQKTAAITPRSMTLQQARLKNEQENEIFLRALITTYFFHLLMEKVYVDFLRINYDPAVTRLDKNATVLCEMMDTHINPNMWLSIQKKSVPRIFIKKTDLDNSYEPAHPFAFLAEIDQRAMRINFKRLLLVRFRRFYLSLVACFVALRTVPIFAFLETWLPKIIAFGNILYFLPRIISDLLNLFYQIFILKPKHVEVSWLDLFKIHFNRRFDVFFRDLLWFANGILGVFVLTGALASWGLWVNMIFQWMEMLLNLIILSANTTHFNQIPDMLSHLGLAREHPKMLVIEKELNRRLDIDFRISYMRMCNSIVISLTSAMILPFFSNISVFIPLAGSIIALMMSYWQYYQLKEGLRNRRAIPDRMFSPDMSSVNGFVSSANLVLN